jgi:peptidoglycan/xylan/chitin deacetylase (PgdA/CDA1 family)
VTTAGPTPPALRTGNAPFFASLWPRAFLDAPLPAPAKYIDGHPVVYLTFDDGPSPAETLALLHVLARHHAKATFFVIGETAAAFPWIVRSEIAAGDAVGGHSWTHPHLIVLSRAAVTAQLSSTSQLIRILGAPARCFRPPYGQTDALVASVAASLHLTQYLWTTITNDFTRASVSADLTRALEGCTPERSWSSTTGYPRLCKPSTSC